MDIKQALNKIATRQDLTGEEMRGVMTTIMNGDATPSQIGAFLMGMRVKGETVGEIAAAVSILREKMVRVDAPEDVIDIVGTGGDGAEPSTSPLPRRSSPPPPACRWPSTATARSRPNPAPPTCCRRSASSST